MRYTKFRETVEYPATVVFDSTCKQHFFLKELEMRVNELTQVARYSASGKLFCSQVTRQF